MVKLFIILSPKFIPRRRNFLRSLINFKKHSRIIFLSRIMLMKTTIKVISKNIIRMRMISITKWISIKETTISHTFLLHRNSFLNLIECQISFNVLLLNNKSISIKIPRGMKVLVRIKLL